MLKSSLALVSLLLFCGTARAQTPCPPHLPAGAGVSERSFNAVIDCITSQINISLPFPASFTSTPLTIGSINIGNYPIGAEMPAGVPQAFKAAMVVPTRFTEAPWPAVSIAAYILSGNQAAANTSMPFFGFSGQTTSNVDPYGANLVIGNCAIVACANNTGFAGNWLGFEVDMNIVKSGGLPVSGIARGIYLAGGSEALPSAGATAIEIHPIGPSLAWSTGLLTDDGGSSIAVNIGATGAGNGVSSQQVVFHSRTAGGVTNSDIILADSAGNITVTMPAGTALSPNGHYANSSGKPMLTSCGGGSPALDNQANDSAGIVAPGSGAPTACTINFAAAYAAIPHCLVSSETSGSTLAITSKNANAFTVTFAGGTPTAFDYKCEQ